MLEDPVGAKKQALCLQACEHLQFTDSDGQ